MDVLVWLVTLPTGSALGWGLFLIYRNASERRVRELAQHGNVHIKITMRGTEVVVWRDEQSERPTEPPGPKTGV